MATTSLLEEMFAAEGSRLFTFTVEQVGEMMRAGIIVEGAPLELIEGALVRKDRAARGEDEMDHGTRHAAAVRMLQSLQGEIERLGAFPQIQLPILLSPTSAPEPDVAILQGAPSRYASRHPIPADVLVVIEVADHSLRYDQTTKLRLYARSGIAVYGIVNLIDDRVEVYEDPLPTEGTYARRRDVPGGETAHLRCGAAVLDVDVAALVRR